MEEVRNMNMNFFTRVYKAITNFDTYSKFAKESLSKAIIYTVILSLIISVVITANYVWLLISKVTNGIDYLNENIEDINFTDGILNFNNNQYVEYADENNLIPIIIVDTSEEPNIDEYTEKISLYNLGVIILKDKIIAKSSTEEELSSIVYSDYNIRNMDKEEIISQISDWRIYAYISIAMIIAEFINFFMIIIIYAVMLAILGQLVGLVLRMRIRFSVTYKMGIYALTLPNILQAVYIIINTRTGFIINSFLWLYMTIAYIYILIAMLMIKTDFINAQKELMKIQMEQDQIREEIARERAEDERKEREREQKRKEEEENNKQDDKKDDKQDEDGLNEQTQE